MSGILAESKLSPIRHFFQTQTLEANGRAKSGASDSASPLPLAMESSGQFYPTLLALPQLLRLIQTFAHRPQNWIHPSHFAKGAFPLQDSQPSDRLEMKTASGISKSFQLPDLDYELFETEHWRLALLDLDSLTRLANHVGIINLIHIFDSTNLTQRAAIAEQLGGVNISELAQLAAEDSFGATFKIPKNWTEDVSQAIDVIGWATLGTIFTEAPTSILKRIELKLPQEIEKMFRIGRKKPMIEAPIVGAAIVHIFKQTENNPELTCIF